MGFNEDDRIFIIVGEHNKNKNQMMVLSLVEEINEVVENARFVFIGDGVDYEKNKNFIKGFTQDFLKVYLETVRSESYWFNHSSDRHRLLFDFQTIPGFLELILWYKLPAKHNVLSKLTKQWHSFSLYTSEVGGWLCK